MAHINPNFNNLPQNYLFTDIARKVSQFKSKHPEVNVISLGVGDVAGPLIPEVIDALKAAADDMSRTETFHGYAPESGYPFLREAIAATDYRDLDISADEIFISDGAKSDTGAIGDIFGLDNIVAVCDPVYPVYVDTNIMSGRAKNIKDFVYLPATADNDFVPELPDRPVDLIYLCFPNNPIGVGITKAQLTEWVDYANETGAVILYDAAYEAFVETPGVVHSIFEIPGARTCAIEFKSLSKTAGFTGMRCAYTVIPKDLERDGKSLNALWSRRQTTKMNGVAYPIQRAAAAVFTPEGQAGIKKQIAAYKENARTMREKLSAAGFDVFGGVDSPYIWLAVPDGDDWAFFDELLTGAGIICTPGSGFGKSGKGYVRLTVFGEFETIREAMARIAAMYQKA